MAPSSLRASAECSGRGTILQFKVGGNGQPVRIRRGPATVIGDAHRTLPLDDLESSGKARRVGPSARRPASGRQADTPSRKGVALVHRILTGSLTGALLVLVCVAPGASSAASP